MAGSDANAQLEQLLSELGKQELAYQRLIEELPAQIRQCALAGDEISADELGQALQDARAMLVNLRKQITSVEGKLYSSRRRK